MLQGQFLSVCLPRLWGLWWSWFECSGVTPHFVISNERKVSVLHLSSGRLIFRLISSWEISQRNQQGALHYFEEDITTWLFWNKNHSFEKKSKCQIKLMNYCLWVGNLGKKGYIQFRKYTNLFRKHTDPVRINRSAPWINLATLLKKSPIISENIWYYFLQLLSPTTHCGGERWFSGHIIF